MSKFPMVSRQCISRCTIPKPAPLSWAGKIDSRVIDVYSVSNIIYPTLKQNTSYLFENVSFRYANPHPIYV